MQLVRPSAEHLPSYIAALERGWSHDNERGAAAAAEELLRTRTDPDVFLASMDDRAAQGPPVTLHESFTKPAQFANRSGLRYRIYLSEAQPPN